MPGFVLLTEVTPQVSLQNTAVHGRFGPLPTLERLHHGIVAHGCVVGAPCRMMRVQLEQLLLGPITLSHRHSESPGAAQRAVPARA